MNTERVHAARVNYRTEDGKVTLHHFASIDGEDWVEVSDDPRVYSLEEIRHCVGMSRDGSKRVRYPMTFTRGYLAHRIKATFLDGEIHG